MAALVKLYLLRDENNKPQKISQNDHEALSELVLEKFAHVYIGREEQEPYVYFMAIKQYGHHFPAAELEEITRTVKDALKEMIPCKP